MTNSRQAEARPLETDTEILSQVVYASPRAWGTIRDEVFLGHLVLELTAMSSGHMYLLAWPDGVRAMLAPAALLGTPEMDEMVVKVYRAAASGYVGPLSVGSVS